MVAVIEDRLEAISELCRRFGVVRLYVFGSVVSGDFRPGESDVDLLVDFGPMMGDPKRTPSSASSTSCSVSSGLTSTW
jgi:uncharacterized protein